MHPDALTIFGATFDETLDDEIRVTVIATGFDKLSSAAALEEKKAASEKEKEPAGKEPAAPVPELKPLDTADDPEPDVPDDDPFEDIFKIFNKRD